MVNNAHVQTKKSSTQKKLILVSDIRCGNMPELLPYYLILLCPFVMFVFSILPPMMIFRNIRTI